ncbi:adenosine kinase 2-like [Leptopilina heterotoma]|uniref:adenosine kinase 2-like n=1 Tax=Leptopilina heterotoma TaxID=63436 RepID=UPI001CAA0D56|nr:adenosine kinase 2-like [Leptopilina heterotoma]
MSVPSILRNCSQLPAVIAFGNPLLDIITRINGNDLLLKYNLKVDGQAELSTEETQQLLQELPPESEHIVTPGGCAQNTLRILQWLCGGAQLPHIGVFYGSIGNDTRGSTLEKLVLADGVDVHYAVHPSLPTGFSINIISDNSWRSLVANLGAASEYSLYNLHNVRLPLETVRIIYIEGFFITHSHDVAKEVCKMVHGKDVIIAFNLSGEYAFTDHYKQIIEMVGMSRIVFGNVNEMKALAQFLNIQFQSVENIPFLLNSVTRVTVNISDTESKDWLSTSGVFVMTQGGDGPATVVWGQGNSAQVHPIIPKAPIIDTTGAGDSLVAGFLAGVIAQKDPKTCLEWGCQTASIIITRLGVTVPSGTPDFID